MELHKKLARLRQEKGWSQEKTAAELGVSRQAVQKWESGAGVPELDNLIRLAQCFRVSLDALVLDKDMRMKQELHQDALIQPDYASQDPCEAYGELMVEYRQCMDEGKALAELETLFQAVDALPAGQAKTRLADVLFDLVQAAPQRADYPYNEPSELDKIQALRPEKQPEKKPVPGKAVLREKIHGAWLGRVCGCLLGKPVEGWRTDRLHPFLKATGNWPMRRYILASDFKDEVKAQYGAFEDCCWADRVDGMPADDDTNYVVLAQELLRRCGRDFRPADVARSWIDLQPKRAYCTAERVAYCNIIKGYQPPNTALFQNPYREWIGAQIRGDYFGYINPGDPAMAAEMAWRDASISHVKNGIYGEMFAAAMIAQAAVEQDIPAIIEAGLSQVPVSSRLYEAVEAVVNNWRNGVSQQEIFAGIHRRFDEFLGHDWCHTIANAMIVAAALLYGGGDYGKSICMAVETGFDTDCNGATVGSVLGMRNGASAIDPEWTRPVQDKLHTAVFGVGTVSIRERAEQTLDHLVHAADGANK